MIRSFGNRIALDIWEQGHSKGLPRPLWIRAKALLTIMHATSRLEDLKLRGQPPNIRLHKLQGRRAGQWSLSIVNDSPWRITFVFNTGEFWDVRIEDYH